MQLLLPDPIDVREISARIRHVTILSILDQLKTGEAVRIASGHDPLPLRLQIEAVHGAAFSWTYVEQGPEVWQIEIGRVDNAASGSAHADAGDPPSGPSCTCGGH